MLGLFAFFYAFLHLLAYAVLDRYFDFAGVWEDVAKRPFITAGMVAFVLDGAARHHVHQGVDPPPRHVAGNCCTG